MPFLENKNVVVINARQFFKRKTIFSISFNRFAILARLYIYGIIFVETSSSELRVFNWSRRTVFYSCSSVTREFFKIGKILHLVMVLEKSSRSFR